jgi:hypothetical protein
MISMLSTLTEGKKTLLIILFAFALYFPLTFLGYGTDCDSESVIKTAQNIDQQDRYIPSRLPGYFVHEFSTAILFKLGGSFLSNVGTMIMSLLTIYFFIQICQYHYIPHKYLLALFLILNPVYWVNSTCTIDYSWALALLLAGYMFLKEKSYITAGILLGLSIGTRLSSIIFVAALFISYVLTKEPDRKKVFLSLAISIAVGALLYLPPFIYMGGSFKFLTYDMGEMDWFGHLARFVYKNIYIIGVQTFIASLLMSPFIIKGFRQNYKDYENILLFSFLIIAGFETMYMKFPLEMSYLLPMLPFLLMLLGISLKNNKGIIIFLLIVQFSYNLVNINIARPDVSNIATSATLGLWIEWGYLITDIINRLAMLS